MISVLEIHYLLQYLLIYSTNFFLINALHTAVFIEKFMVPFSKFRGEIVIFYGILSHAPFYIYLDTSKATIHNCDE